MADATPLLFPAGRLIMGSLYKGSDKDSKGVPRTVKTGPNKGQPITQFFFGVAIPKAGEQHWSQTTWGATVLAIGAAAFPAIYQTPTFAWKIDDGDSAVPNKAGKRPCDMEGAKGHWVVKFSSGFAPSVYAQPSPGVFQALTTPDAVKAGHWIQVNGTIAGNGSTESPGVYINHGMVLFVRTDTEISQGPDAASVFAGAAVSQGLPTGMPAVPFAAAVPPAIGLPVAPVALPQAPVVVAPNPAFLTPAPAVMGLPAAMPMAPGLPPAPVAPPVPAGPVLTPAGVASGFTYAQYRASGWTDEQLRANHYLA